jgi:spore maturation protein CgeB
MVDCVEEAGAPRAEGLPLAPYAAAPTLQEEFDRWDLIGSVLVTELRDKIVRAAASHLGQDLMLVGKNWERVGLAAQKEHSGIPAAKDYYATSQASLNLFGGSVHGGMPLRPYEIACSHGLLFTQYNRELPSLFEPERECVAFRNVEQMIEGLDRILSHPADFDRVAAAGYRRASTEHTWEDRMKKVLQAAKQQFDLPWD